MKILRYKEESAVCIRCKAELPKSSKFCPFCGEKVVRRGVCPKCGDRLVAGAQFCRACGAAVPAELLVPDELTMQSGSSVFAKFSAVVDSLCSSKVVKGIVASVVALLLFVWAFSMVGIAYDIAGIGCLSSKSFNVDWPFVLSFWLFVFSPKTRTYVFVCLTVLIAKMFLMIITLEPSSVLLSVFFFLLAMLPFAAVWWFATRPKKQYESLSAPSPIQDVFLVKNSSAVSSSGDNSPVAGVPATDAPVNLREWRRPLAFAGYAILIAAVLAGLSIARISYVCEFAGRSSRILIVLFWQGLGGYFWMTFLGIAARRKWVTVVCLGLLILQYFVLRGEAGLINRILYFR